MNESTDCGAYTLEVISQADSFNRWIYQTIMPHCSGKILEIGSGIGNISKYFIDGGFSILLSDIETDYIIHLRNKFPDHVNKNPVIKLNFADQNIEENYPGLIGNFDTIIALNVLEHIRDHHIAIRNAGKMLKAGGKLVVQVPAFQVLFNQFDQHLGHQRRYTGKQLKAVVEKAGLQVTHSQYFNFVGAAGWLIMGTFLRKRRIPGNQMHLFDFFVPLWKSIDFITKRFAGISVIQIGQKQTIHIDHGKKHSR